MVLCSRLVDGFDELRPADPVGVVHVESQEMLSQELAAVGPREAAAERFHRTRQLLVRVSVEIELLSFRWC